MYPLEQCAATGQLVTLSGGRRAWLFDGDRPRVGLCGDCNRLSCGGCVRLGSNAGAKAGQVIGAGSSVAAGILTAAGVSGPAAPIVAAVGAIAALIAGFFGKGCGQACIQSATLEQVPEAAMWSLHAVALQQPGAISAAEFKAAWQNIQSIGIQQLQNLLAQGDKKAQDGINNLQNSLNYSDFVTTLPAVPTAALDLNQAQAAFLDPNTKGWYASSVASGNQLALQVLQSLSSVSGAGSTVTALEQATGLSKSVLFLGAAAAAYFILKGRT